MMLIFVDLSQQIALIGSCERPRMPVHDLGGTGDSPGKIVFVKNDDITGYLIFEVNK